MASCALPALLIQGERTAHSRFKLPLAPNETSTCNILLQSSLAKLIRDSVIIIFDEVPITHKFLFHSLDRTLRDITGIDVPFGGRIFLWVVTFFKHYQLSNTDLEIKFFKHQLEHNICGLLPEFCI